MSFEGYYQILCTNGHFSTAELDIVEEKWQCPFCEEKIGWQHIAPLQVLERSDNNLQAEVRQC